MDHGAAIEEQTALFVRVVGGIHHLHGQFSLLEQVAELDDPSLVTHRSVGQVQPSKVANRLDLVECIFRFWSRQRVPMLHEVNPQHRSKRHRRTLASSRRRAVRLDHLQPRYPRHDLLPIGHRRVCFFFRSEASEARIFCFMAAARFIE